MITREEERELLRRFQEERDEAARSALVESHKRYVYKWAGRLRARFKKTHIPLDDVAQAGLIKLFTSIAKIDLSRNVRLLSFATHGIYCAIARALMGGCDGAGDLRSDLRGNSARSLDALFAKTEQTIGQLEDPDNAAYGGDGRFDIPDDFDDDDLDLVEQFAFLRDALPSLTERERIVLYGRSAGDTFKSIGSRLGCTRERVRQIEERALQKLRRLAKDNTDIPIYSRRSIASPERTHNGKRVQVTDKQTDWKAKMAAKMRERNENV